MLDKVAIALGITLGLSLLLFTLSNPWRRLIDVQRRVDEDQPFDDLVESDKKQARQMWFLAIFVAGIGWIALLFLLGGALWDKLYGPD